MDFLEENWLDLDWSPWVPFNAPREFWYIQKAPGVYRIRPDDKDLLMYIGETGQSLHKKLAGLRQTLRRGDIMPWSDPYSEAPALWCWWVEWIADRENDSCKDPSSPSAGEPGDLEPVMLEVSSAPLDASVSGRKGMENFLLSAYRQETGESPLCNFGRFHPRYRKSTTRAESRRGGKLTNTQKDNPAGFPSISPLEPAGEPGDSDWMGLEWTVKAPLCLEHARTVGEGAGLYLLADAGSREILLIGQSADIAGRLLGLCGKDYGGREVLFSYQIIGQNVLPHNLKELEADLVGNYYGKFRRVPEFQFRGIR
ncbi:hypothetical protein [Methanoregula sp.]|uniref:hypothetical protein n=1 Tax=Methanoregula sp. TaxID=2052170 RepID=UPI00261FC86E|nr:hypothetical protein [Methanoregula sp.]MDD5143510.1 hypothetical protein [Methanoregula sp.]